MGRLDEMRAAAAKGKKLAPAPEPAAPPPAPAAKPNPVVVEVPAKEVITFTCGHKIGVHHFKCHPCQECIGKAKKQRNVKKNELRNKRAAEEGAAKQRDIGRLPAGCVKRLSWNGEEWHGIMVVPGVPVEFTATASSEKKCYHDLHNAYVKWLAEQPKEGV